MKKIIAVAASTASMLSAATMAFATNPELPQITVNPQDDGLVRITDPGRLISSFVSGAIVFALILVLFYLILGGIQWITSGGDKGKTEAARNKITSAVVGLAIVAAAWAIFTVIGYLFGVDIAGSGLQESLEQIRPY
jgi:hypothetical protein